MSHKQVERFQQLAAHPEIVLDAEVRIGELMASVPKATPNNNPFHQRDTGVPLVKSKQEILEEAGFKKKQVERFQPWLNFLVAIKTYKKSISFDSDEKK